MRTKLSLLLLSLVLILVPALCLPSTNLTAISHSKLVGVQTIAMLFGMATLTWMLSFILIGAGICLLCFLLIDLVVDMFAPETCNSQTCK